MDSVQGVIRFLVIEGILLAVLMLGLLGVKKYVEDAEAKKWVGLIIILAIGGLMLFILLRFAGIA
jgi:hypothetical protein